MQIKLTLKHTWFLKIKGEEFWQNTFFLFWESKTHEQSQEDARIQSPAAGLRWFAIQSPKGTTGCFSVSLWTFFPTRTPFLNSVLPLKMSKQTKSFLHVIEYFFLSSFLFLDSN